MKMNPKNLIVLTVLMVGLVAGCSSTPEKTGEPAVQPGDVLTNAEAFKFKAANWGGAIVQVQNFQAHTDIEVIAYPLKRSGLPDFKAQPLGRFVARKKEFIEPANYPVGRLLTVDGSVLGTETGSVGEAEYVFPVLLAHELKLWAVQDPDIGRSGPNVHFGIGIGSGGRSSIGIGIGF